MNESHGRRVAQITQDHNVYQQNGMTVKVEVQTKLVLKLRLVMGDIEHIQFLRTLKGKA